MNDFGKRIERECCSDCIALAGQAYCTMNCGPVGDKAPPSPATERRPRTSETIKTRIERRPTRSELILGKEQTE